MAGKGVRQAIKLRSTEGSGYVYMSNKSRRNTPGRLELRKYDPVLRRHVIFREER